MKNLKIVFLLIALAAGVCSVPADCGASVEHCRVIEIFGRAEIQEAGGVWQPLSAPRLLKGGDKIRTYEKSYADFSSSADLSGLMRLGPDARVEVMGDDLTRFFVRQGSFFVLREEDVAGPRRKEETLFQVFTRDLVADLLQGGMSVSVLQKGSLLCVFSEHAKASLFSASREKIYAQTVAEGFKLFVESPAKPAAPQRLLYDDYGSWQFWMRKCYDRKDDLAKNFTKKASP